MNLLAIDPGSTASGWVLFDPETSLPVMSGKTDNEELITLLRDHTGWLWQPTELYDHVVIEWSQPRGMLGSAQWFETLWWAGRFTEAARPLPVDRLDRDVIKRHLCGRTNVNDTQIRAALIDRYGGIGGKAKAVGRKNTPGPLYGIKTDAWAALAVAVTFIEQMFHEEVRDGH